MKKTALFGILIVSSLLGCSRAREQNRSPRAQAAVPTTPALAAGGSEWNAYWHAGKAELTRYELEQARYGEVHRGHAVLIFVTEPFLPGRQVKSDRGAVPGSKSVLKLNLTKSFNTGLYPYTLMTSVFTPVDASGNRPSFKVSTSAQEWCGHTYLQLNLRGDDYRVTGHSYFESEGDQKYSVPRALLEDEVWTRIRLAPTSLPVGKLKVIPGTLDGRLRHHKVRVEKAVASLENKGKLGIYTLRYPDSKRTLAIRFETAFPHRIVGWKETYRSGWGARARVLTTSARRTHSLYVPYWQLNRVRDLPLRSKLGLDPGAAAPATRRAPSKFPSTGKVKSLVQRDLACYVTVVVAGGKERTLMGDFDLCQQTKRFLGKQVRLSYKPGTVNDCESIEPCGKSKLVNLVNSLTVVP